LVSRPVVVLVTEELMAHPSLHLSHVQIGQLDQFLLLQTLRGAVDVVSGEMVRDLGRPDLAGLSETEVETLKRRGHLTESSAEEEQEQGRAVLRVLSGRVQRAVELSFVFPPDAGQTLPPEVTGGSLIEELFSLAYEAAGEQAGVMTNLDISSARVDAATLDLIIEKARDRDCPILPRLTVEGLDAIEPWLKSENFRRVVVNSSASSAPLDVDKAVAGFTQLFARQILPAWRCEIDGMSDEQLAAVRLIHERVQQKYPLLRLDLVSERMREADPPDSVAACGAEMPLISAANVPVLGTLMNFTFMSNRINYRPFFEPGPRALTCDLATGEVTCTPDDAEVFVGLDEVRARLLDEKREPKAAAGMSPEELAEGALCKYALICGCGRPVTNGANNGTAACAQLYEQRLRQVLPLFIFNLRKKGAAQQPAAAGVGE
jgi:hypothetical protein